MLCYLFAVLSVLASAWITWGTGIYWLWALPIFVGIYIALQPLCFLVLWFSTIFLPKKDPIEKPMRGVYFMIWLACNWVTTLFRIKITFEGMEQFPNEPFILVSNHQSNFDPVVVLAMVKKRKIAFISKASNFKIPVAGPYMRNAGFLAIDRENAMSAMRTLKRAGEMMLREEMIMGIYPEGTRSKTGELLEFKEGAFLLAKRTNAPIVVITTKGTNQIAKRMLLRRTNVELKVVELIDRETVKALSMAELAAHVKETVQKNLNA